MSSICPYCGERKFNAVIQNNKRRSYKRCSACKGVGWIGEPKGTGTGAQTCKRCGERRLHTIFGNSKTKSILYCTNIECRSVMIFNGRPPSR